MKKNTDCSRKPVCLGVEDYIAAQDCYYVDKTMLIEEVMTTAHVNVILRPEGFGKTLNLSMIKTFFEKTDRDTSVYFKDKKIWQCGRKVREEQGQYPVIMLTLGDVKCGNWEEMRKDIVAKMRAEAIRHSELLDSDKLDDNDLETLRKFINGEENIPHLYDDWTLRFLQGLLSEHYGKQVIVLIDDYDAPVCRAVDNGFYKEAKDFMQHFILSTVSHNQDCRFAVFDSITPLAFSDMFGPLDNFFICGTDVCCFSKAYGFTGDEVKALLAYYGHEDKYDEVREWYGGYMSENTEVFYPWSVMSYIQHGCVPDLYWVKRYKTSLVDDMLLQDDEDIRAVFRRLADGVTVIDGIHDHKDYSRLQRKTTDVYALLFLYGYVYARRVDPHAISTLDYITSPNREMRTAIRNALAASE